jgi:hypothetical protein
MSCQLGQRGGDLRIATFDGVQVPVGRCRRGVAEAAHQTLVAAARVWPVLQTAANLIGFELALSNGGQLAAFLGCLIPIHDSPASPGTRPRVAGHGGYPGWASSGQAGHQCGFGIRHSGRE